MQPETSLYRLVGIAATTLTAIQAVAWMILSFLAILAYLCVLAPSVNGNDPEFNKVLYGLYFYNPNCDDSELKVYSEVTIMSPVDTNLLMSTYLAMSSLWLLASCMCILEFYTFNLREMFWIKVLFWILVTAGICLMDFVAGILYGIDFGRIRRESLKPKDEDREGTESLHEVAAAFMMSMSMRGFLLWLVNVLLLVHMFLQTRKQQSMGAAVGPSQPVPVKACKKPAVKKRERTSTTSDLQDNNVSQTDEAVEENEVLSIKKSSSSLLGNKATQTDESLWRRGTLSATKSVRSSVASPPCQGGGANVQRPCDGQGICTSSYVPSYHRQNIKNELNQRRRYSATPFSREDRIEFLQPLKRTAIARGFSSRREQDIKVTRVGMVEAPVDVPIQTEPPLPHYIYEDSVTQTTFTEVPRPSLDGQQPGEFSSREMPVLVEVLESSQAQEAVVVEPETSKVTCTERPMYYLKDKSEVRRSSKPREASICESPASSTSTINKQLTEVYECSSGIRQAGTDAHNKQSDVAIPMYFIRSSQDAERRASNGFGVRSATQSDSEVLGPRRAEISLPRISSADRYVAVRVSEENTESRDTENSSEDTFVLMHAPRAARDAETQVAGRCKCGKPQCGCKICKLPSPS